MISDKISYTARLSRWECLVNKDVLIKDTIFLLQIKLSGCPMQLCSYPNVFSKKLFLITKNKETPVQVFSCEFCEIFKNNFFVEHLWATASKNIFLTLEENLL